MSTDQIHFFLCNQGTYGASHQIGSLCSRWPAYALAKTIIGHSTQLLFRKLARQRRYITEISTFYRSHHKLFSVLGCSIPGTLLPEPEISRLLGDHLDFYQGELVLPDQQKNITFIQIPKQHSQYVPFSS
jgi:hypothetical protein